MAQGQIRGNGTAGRELTEEQVMDEPSVALRGPSSHRGRSMQSKQVMEEPSVTRVSLSRASSPIKAGSM